MAVTTAYTNNLTVPSAAALGMCLTGVGCFASTVVAFGIRMQQRGRGHAGETAFDAIATAAGLRYGGVTSLGEHAVRSRAGKYAYRLHSALGDVVGLAFSLF